jgi:uncharacterized membrane protein YkoI
MRLKVITIIGTAILGALILAGCTQTLPAEQTPAPSQTEQPVQTPPPAQGNTSNFIGEAAAKSAALAHAGISEADAAWLRCVLDRDDGYTLYEVGFRVGYIEYDYDIDALTGNIVSYDREDERYDD